MVKVMPEVLRVEVRKLMVMVMGLLSSRADMDSFILYLGDQS